MHHDGLRWKGKARGHAAAQSGQQQHAGRSSDMPSRGCPVMQPRQGRQWTDRGTPGKERSRQRRLAAHLWQRHRHLARHAALLVDHTKPACRQTRKHGRNAVRQHWSGRHTGKGPGAAARAGGPSCTGAHPGWRRLPLSPCTKMPGGSTGSQYGCLSTLYAKVNISPVSGSVLGCAVKRCVPILPLQGEGGGQGGGMARFTGRGCGGWPTCAECACNSTSIALGRACSMSVNVCQGSRNNPCRTAC